MAKAFQGDGSGRFFDLGDIPKGKQTEAGKKANDALNKALGIGKYAKKATKKTGKRKK